jgi:putative DNA primase/helicase
MRIALWRNGYRPVPIVGPHIAIKSAGKRPQFADWIVRCTSATVEDIPGWTAAYRDATNTGLMCGEVVAVDVDVSVYALAGEIQNLAREMLGPTPLTRIGRAPRLLMVFRTEHPFKKLATDKFTLPDGAVAQVELLALGQQFVAFGIHPDTKAEYVWPDQSPIAVPVIAIPLVSHEACIRFLQEAERRLRAAGGQTAAELRELGRSGADTAGIGDDKISRAVVADALSHVPNADLDYDEWIKIGFSLYAALGAGGRDLWENWSAKSGKNDPAYTSQKWSSFAGGRSTIGTLFWHAQRNGWVGTETQQAHPELPKRIILDPADPMRTARELVVASFADAAGLQKLRRHRGAFWLWTGSYYRLADDEAIRAGIWTFLEKASQRGGKGLLVPFKPNRERVGNALDALGAVTQLDHYIDPPTWLTSNSMPAPAEFLACGNGLLHLPSGKLYPPTPDHFNLYASEIEFDPDAPEPVQWLTFLDQLFNDPLALELLQDWFGYLLAPNTSQQKILLVVGPKRSGKGTIARVMTGVLGRHSVGGPPMSSLAEQFGLEPLITKSLAIVSDMRIGARIDKSAIVERLLSVSGEDLVTVARKNRAAWHGRLPTRFVILTNELPSLNDGSGALAGRFMMLLLTESFFGREDTALTDKLLCELPGILNWAVEGYRRLHKRGYFVQPKNAKESIDDFEMLAAPVKAFIRDCCNVGPLMMVKTDDLWSQWQRWCASDGRKDVGTKGWFGRNLRTAEPGITIKKRGTEGERVFMYEGIQLMPKISPRST